METFTIRNLSFSYPMQKRMALDGVSLSVAFGEFVVLCGKSGCGKSTLLRNLKTALAPAGQRSGEILFYGRQLETVEKREQASRIGYVLQNPDSQIVTDKVWHELAFGLESLGYDTETIRLRVAEMASFFGIQTWFMKNVSELSGGQKQLLNLAAVMVMQPDVLVLDEPTSQLDPIAAGEFLETVKKINREIGTTVIMTEHRLEDALAMADRAIALDKGKIIADDIPENVGAALASMRHSMFLAMPTPLMVYAALYREGIAQDLPCPITVRDGRNWLTKLFAKADIQKRTVDARPLREREGEEPVVRLKEVWYKYGKQDADIIKDLSLSVYAGELFCLVGGNGSGKTTTLKLIGGIMRAYRGKLSVKGKAALLPQNPQALFVEKTVMLDLMEGLSGQNLTKQEKEEKALEIARLMEIEDLLSMHPYDLSGGEQQRAALGKVLLLQPDILLLDEPTKGLDAWFKMKFAGILSKLRAQGITMVIVSHDIEFCARYADRCAMLFDGGLTASGTPNQFFSGNNFYTTAANRMSRHIFENAVTTEELLSLCRINLNRGDTPMQPYEPFEPESGGSPKAEGAAPQGKTPSQSSEAKIKEPLSKKGKLSLILSLVLIPAALFAGVFLLGDRKYYFISLMLILLIMVPFFLVFEQRKPKAREIIVVSVMIALTVAGRAAFFMTPSFKPVIALVVIAGMALGAEAGFLTGAMAGFLSNFMFGQGPWTPWQMFAYGLIGFLAGLLASKGWIGAESKKKVILFGTIAAFFIYGGVVDLWTIFGMSSRFESGIALTVYTLAIPFNLVHAVSTAIFLYLLSNPMMEKLERVKRKYGMFS